VNEDFLTLTVRRHPAADDALVSIEFSNDLATWFDDPAHVVLVSRSRMANGTIVELWRAQESISAQTKQFLRLRARSR